MDKQIEIDGDALAALLIYNQQNLEKKINKVKRASTRRFICTIAIVSFCFGYLSAKIDDLFIEEEPIEEETVKN